MNSIAARKLKALIDCTPLSAGGGVQVAVGLLANLFKSKSIDWQAVVPHVMRAAMPDEIAGSSRMRFLHTRSHIDRIKATRYLHSIEAEMCPDVAFSVFGPTLFRARAPHLVGFAKPHLIYARDLGMPGRGMKGAVFDAFGSFLFRRADHIVVETQIARERFAQCIQFDPARISVISNAPNPLLKRLPDIPQPDQPFGILMPSAWYWHKNLDMAPLVAREIAHGAPDLDFQVRLTLPPDSAHWRRIEASAHALGVARNVTTLGALPIEELASAYRNASVVFLPTQREISTAVYPEAFFFRRPLVTSDEDFAKELCGDAAIFTPARDAIATAARLIELASSPEMCRRLVVAGEEQLAAHYPTPQEKFEMQLALLENVAAAGRKQTGRII